MTVPARVNAEGGRVAYRWDATLEEWYVNDTRGLEHGYTVHQRPPQGEDQGPLTFTLTVRGELAPEVQDDGRCVRFIDGGGAAMVTYSGLAVFDADGHTLHARLESVFEGLENKASQIVKRDPIAGFHSGPDLCTQRGQSPPALPHQADGVVYDRRIDETFVLG